MSWVTASVLLWLAATQAQPVERFALIVSNNRSADPGRPSLQYADDDGVSYAALFTEGMRDEHVFLLTQTLPRRCRERPEFDEKRYEQILKRLFPSQGEVSAEQRRALC